MIEMWSSQWKLNTLLLLPVVDPDFVDSEKEIYCVKNNFAIISEEYGGHNLRGIELLETVKLKLQIEVETMRDLRSVIDPHGENIVVINSRKIYFSLFCRKGRYWVRQESH